jgi:hypothetical protein
MANTPKNTLKELAREIHGPINSFARDLYLEIVKTTPKRTGAASRSWTKPKKITPEDFNGIITSSNLPYVPRLDEGYSKQAPEGFIQPSIDRILRRYKR